METRAANSIDKAALCDRIEDVQGAAARAAASVGRDPGAVTIVAVSKSVSRGEIDAAYELGMRHFGENRVQDALRKLDHPLPDDAALHMVGQLQSNKCAQALRIFDVVQSVDRLSLITELEKQAAKYELTVSVLLQVNVAGEAQKAGCDPVQVPELARSLVVSDHLSLQGLMTIAPLVGDAEDVRPVFRALRELRDNVLDQYGSLVLPVLSMGMTNDFEVAIQEGATHVRIGRAIFGG